MEALIFSDFGIEIFKRDRRIYIRYDAGEIASHDVESEITIEESIKAQKSGKDSYEVILACQKREANKCGR